MEFEVGVIVSNSATDNKEGNAKAGISVKLANLVNAEANAGGGLSQETANTNQSTHNLKFQVFVSEEPS